jgi:hypothetical protein
MGSLEIENRDILIKDKQHLTGSNIQLRFSFAVLMSKHFMHFFSSIQEAMNVNILRYAIMSYVYWELRLKCTSIFEPLL